MSGYLRKLLLALATAGVVQSASAFSMLGPYATWQTTDIGYNPRGFDIGGPMNLGEEYRWNVQTITYGFDKSFLDYFGQRGVVEVNKAIAIYNALPPMSKLSPSLSEIPQDTRRENFQAEALGIIDLKSYTMSLLIEHLGLASPERYIWTLRSRTVVPQATNYIVIQRNFDPVTLNPSPYVNGTLYTYTIYEFGPSPNFSDAFEVLVDPLASFFTSVACVVGRVSAVYPLGGGVLADDDPTPSGTFFTGLTRDDVGGLRHLYAAKGQYVTYHYENLPLDALSTSLGSPWGIPGAGGGSNNLLVSLALRPGIDKILFKQMKNESYIGNFIATTNQYKDTYITNSHRATQKYERALTTPDIIFAAGDLGLTQPNGIPVIYSRTTTASWINNSALNSSVTGTGIELDGPGEISGTVVITYTTSGPFIWNRTPSFLDQANYNGIFGGWGAFDGTTNPPVVFPDGASIQALQQMVLGGGN